METSSNTSKVTIIVYHMIMVYQKDHLNQEIGNIETCQDRCVVFPNVFQHCVKPFSLLDKTKNGHRTMLIFFLVNPFKYVIGTDKISSQQKSWVSDEILNNILIFNNDITNIIIDYCDLIKKRIEISIEINERKEIY